MAGLPALEPHRFSWLPLGATSVSFFLPILLTLIPFKWHLLTEVFPDLPSEVRLPVSWSCSALGFSFAVFLVL